MTKFYFTIYANRTKVLVVSVEMLTFAAVFRITTIIGYCLLVIVYWLYERTIHHFAVAAEQRFHDAGLVWSPEASGDGRF